MITYSALFYSQEPDSSERKPHGVVTVDISMAQVKNIIESLGLGPKGFGALTTFEGNYLYHPHYQYVTSQKNIRDIALEKNDNDRFILAEKASQKEHGIIEHTSTTTGQAGWFIFEPIPSSGWSLQNTFIKSDIPADITSQRHEIIWIILCSNIFFFLFLFALFYISSHRSVAIWVFSVLSSLVMALSTCAIWFLALNYQSKGDDSGIKLTDKESLNVLQSSYTKAHASKELSPPLFVPTGVYLETVEFTNANYITLTGRIWQKYSDTIPATIPKGFLIGESKNTSIEKIEETLYEGGSVIQWIFSTDIQADLDYSRYPLEVEYLSLHLSPKSSNSNIVLTPDLDSYKLFAPALLPGLDIRTFLPGWEFIESYFSWSTEDINTSFGLAKNFDQENLPELMFKIGIKRVFVDAFISNLTPLIVVLIILYAVTMLPKEIDISRVLGISVSVFFVVVFSHLAIRKTISIGEIFYLEYFFFVVYTAILTVPIKTFNTLLHLKINFLERRNGLVLTIMYWPVLQAIFLGITVLKFY